MATEGITLVNLAHPLLAVDVARVGELAGAEITRTLLATLHLADAEPVPPQVRTLLDRLPLSAEE